MAGASGAVEQDELLTALARPNQADLDEFRRGVDPLAERGKLGALLAQFPPSFKNGEAERGYLIDLLQRVQRLPRRGRAPASKLERHLWRHARAPERLRSRVDAD